MRDHLAASWRERDHTEARLRALIAALPDPVFVLDARGNIVEVLAGRTELPPLPALELEGRPVAALLAPDRAKALDEVVATALHLAAPQRFAYELEIPHGKRWFDAVLVPIATVETSPRASLPSEPS